MTVDAVAKAASAWGRMLMPTPLALSLLVKKAGSMSAPW